MSVPCKNCRKDIMTFWAGIIPCPKLLGKVVFYYSGIDGAYFCTDCGTNAARFPEIFKNIKRYIKKIEFYPNDEEITLKIASKQKKYYKKGVFPPVWEE